MAIYHLTTRGGKAHQGRAIRHSDYIAREGIYAERNDLIAREVGNMPTWAQTSSADFWQACDELERANGRAYREFEVALPRELTHEQQRELVRQFVSEQLGNKHVYEWALHDKGDGNPHAHIMFSERMQDGIERERELFFKRANSKTPERGGCAKDDGWRGTKGNPPVRLQEARARWADLQNAHLERAGELARVDHRTLAAQGIDRIPQLHVGFQDEDRIGVHAERQQRNENIKLANQEAQTRAELAGAMREMAELEAKLKAERDRQERLRQSEEQARERQRQRQQEVIAMGQRLLIEAAEVKAQSQERASIDLDLAQMPLVDYERQVLREMYDRMKVKRDDLVEKIQQSEKRNVLRRWFAPTTPEAIQRLAELEARCHELNEWQKRGHGGDDPELNAARARHRENLAKAIKHGLVEDPLMGEERRRKSREAAQQEKVQEQAEDLKNEHSGPDKGGMEM